MEFNTKNDKNILLIIFAGILFYVGIQNLSGIISAIGWVLSLIFPFILGGAIAFIFNVPLKQIEKLVKKIKIIKSDGIRRGISYLLTLLAIILVLIIVSFVVIPELINTTNSLIKQIPIAYDSAQDYLQTLENRWPQMMDYINQNNIDLNNMSQKLVQFLQNGVMGFLSSTVGVVGSVVSAITTFFIAFAFSVYLLFKKEKFSSQFKKLLYAILPQKKVDRMIYVGQLSNTTFSNFISGQCLEAMILGSMFFVSMTILRMPYAVMMGVVIALTALVPIFGSLAGFVIGFFLILIVNPMQALGFIVLFFTLQQIEGNLIYPHVVGGSVGLPSIWVLVAVTLGGSLMGIVGMLIFIPGASVCYTLLREFVNRKVCERKIAPKKWE